VDVNVVARLDVLPAGEIYLAIVELHEAPVLGEVLLDERIRQAEQQPLVFLREHQLRIRARLEALPAHCHLRISFGTGSLRRKFASGRDDPEDFALTWSYDRMFFLTNLPCQCKHPVKLQTEYMYRYVSSASMCSSALLQAAGQCLCHPAIVQHATSLLPLEEEFMGRTYMLAIRKLSYDHFFRCHPRLEDWFDRVSDVDEDDANVWGTLLAVYPVIKSRATSSASKLDTSVTQRAQNTIVGCSSFPSGAIILMSFRTLHERHTF
jgi:hypothetical protein